MYETKNWQLLSKRTKSSLAERRAGAAHIGEVLEDQVNHGIVLVLPMLND